MAEQTWNVADITRLVVTEVHTHHSPACFFHAKQNVRVHDISAHQDATRNLGLFIDCCPLS